MKSRISGLAAALTIVLATATGAQAQETGSGPAELTPEEIAATVDQLIDQIEPFAAQNNIPAFTEEVRQILQTYLPASMVVVPADKAADDSYEWAGGLTFDTGYDVPEDGVLVADPARAIYGDAQACSAANGGRTVAHFRRIREGVLIGHICTVGYVEGDKAMLTTMTLVEGGGRRAWSNFDGYARVVNQPQSALDLMEPVIEGNVALAEAFDAVMIRNLPLAAPNRPAGGAAEP